MHKIYNGVEYSFPISYLILGNQENFEDRYDVKNTSESFGHNDECLDEQMFKSSKNIDKLIIEKCNISIF